MLTQKKIISPNTQPLGVKKIQSSPAKIKGQPNDKKQSNKSPKKSYIGGGSMLKFFKQGAAEKQKTGSSV